MNLVLQLDQLLFTIINNAARRWPWLDNLARLFLNDYFVPTLMAVTLLALWFEESNTHKRLTNRRAVLVAALGAAVANSLLKLLNLVYYRPRPFFDVKVNLLFYHPTDSSLPSNAATLGFAIAVGVWFNQRQWGWFLLGLATIFGLSRVIGGVHYPLDVVAGAALGWFSAWIIHRQKTLTDKLLRLMMIVTERLDFP